MNVRRLAKKANEPLEPEAFVKPGAEPKPQPVDKPRLTPSFRASFHDPCGIAIGLAVLTGRHSASYKRPGHESIRLRAMLYSRPRNDSSGDPDAAPVDGDRIYRITEQYTKFLGGPESGEPDDVIKAVESVTARE